MGALFMPARPPVAADKILKNNSFLALALHAIEPMH
jgi:hypothetical protein